MRFMAGHFSLKLSASSASPKEGWHRQENCQDARRRGTAELSVDITVKAGLPRGVMVCIRLLVVKHSHSLFW